MRVRSIAPIGRSPVLANRQDQSVPIEGGGETGIRTLGTLARTHAFQACALSHSAISPQQHPMAGGDSISERASGANPNCVPCLYGVTARDDTRLILCHPRHARTPAVRLPF